MAPSKPQTRFRFYAALTQCGGPQQIANSPESAGGDPRGYAEEGGGSEGAEGHPHPPSGHGGGGRLAGNDASSADDPRSLLVGDA
eukprot:CAMPEP_0113589182 /NCGR_PEP_ID=MMETSP0015_2-20120614/35938_1 /TAXON_ID=2838 /ORGANISM="Odontella" /LENGTH=84 /DNA_ID=CAMNT_0000495157 /DNA_START=483 /DNA_END=733 /DNA_ORIENTATION=+ /assembly_acc=CAM_ASM_000160